MKLPIFVGIARGLVCSVGGVYKLSCWDDQGASGVLMDDMWVGYQVAYPDIYCRSCSFHTPCVAVQGCWIMLAFSISAKKREEFGMYCKVALFNIETHFGLILYCRKIATMLL